jgi:hypothetical protein
MGDDAGRRLVTLLVDLLKEDELLQFDAAVEDADVARLRAQLPHWALGGTDAEFERWMFMYECARQMVVTLKQVCDAAGVDLLGRSRAALAAAVERMVAEGIDRERIVVSDNALSDLTILKSAVA